MPDGRSGGFRELDSSPKQIAVDLVGPLGPTPTAGGTRRERSLLHHVGHTDANPEWGSTGQSTASSATDRKEKPVSEKALHKCLS